MALAERGDARLQDVDRLVHRSPTVAVGAFRCPSSHPLFVDTGPIENDVFVFPRGRVCIAHAGGRRFAADPGVVTLYNRGQLYARGAIDDADRSDYFAVDRALALEAAHERDPDVGERPFRFDHAPTAPGVYLRQRALFERLVGGPVDALEVEETVLALLAAVLDGAYAARGRTTAVPDDRDAEDVVRDARMAVGARFTSGLTLAELARCVGTSRARLCRLFRRVAGTTIHSYREQLRLRAALEALSAPRADLTELALELGYSSHSHFSANFKRAFGIAPSEARARLRNGGDTSGRR